MRSKEIPRLFVIIGIPIGLILLAGIVGPLVRGLFFIVALALSLALVVLLVLHKLIFPSIRWARDAFNIEILLPYAAVFSGFAFFGLIYIIPNHAQRFDPSLRAGNDLLDPIVLGIAGWMVFVPLTSSFLADIFGRNKKRAGKGRTPRQTMAFLSLVMIPVLVVLSGLLWRSAPTFQPGIKPVLLVHVLVLTLGGLISLWMFREILLVEEKALTKLNDQPTIWFVLPGSLTVFNLVTIVQGFTGLIDHYAFLRGLAVGGIVVNVIAILCVLLFGASFVRRGLKRRNLTHLMMATSFSLSFGCVVTYASAELGGVILKHYLLTGLVTN